MLRLAERKGRKTWVRDGFIGQRGDCFISRLFGLWASNFLYGLRHFGLCSLLPKANSPLTDTKAHLENCLILGGVLDHANP